MTLLSVQIKKYANNLKKAFQSLHIFISSDKDIITTLNIYTDVTKELKRTEFDGLDKYFNNSIA